jgi:hypothetical protein
MMHVSEPDQAHLCSFDSFLHATICTNLHSTNATKNCVKNTSTTCTTPNKVSHSSATKNPKSNGKSKIPCKQNTRAPGQHCQQLKLKTSVLNQINPDLSAEQKLFRKLNDVEKWLMEREQHNHINSYRTDNVVEKTRLQKDQENLMMQQQDKNIYNSNVVNKFKTADESIPVTSTPKKVFNKEILITKKAKTTQQKNNNNTKNQYLLEYSNVPIQVDASECENLISISDDDVPPSTSASTVVNNQDQENVENDENRASASNVSSVTSKSSQSTVHRYVHEHIHLHYHYLKNENND